MSELQTVSITIGILTACVSVVIGVANSIMSNRRAEKQRELTQQTQKQALETRQAQLFMQIYNRWSSRDSVKAYARIRYGAYEWTDLEDYMEKYGPSVDPDAFADQVTMNHFFDGLGVLVKKGLIDISLVKDLFSQRIIWFWKRNKDIIHELRKFTGDPTQYNHIEYLYHELKQLQ